MMAASTAIAEPNLDQKLALSIFSASSGSSTTSRSAGTTSRSTGVPDRAGRLRRVAGRRWLVRAEAGDPLASSLAGAA